MVFTASVKPVFIRLCLCALLMQCLLDERHGEEHKDHFLSGSTQQATSHNMNPDSGGPIQPGSNQLSSFLTPRSSDPPTSRAEVTSCTLNIVQQIKTTKSAFF